MTFRYTTKYGADMATRKKARMGRPPKGKDARKVRILLKATPAEAAAWRKASKAESMGLGPWIAKPRRDELKGS